MLLGNTHVGKTAIGRRWEGDTFSPSTLATLSVELYKKKLTIDEKRVTVQMWDTAGEERFHSITTSYFRNSRRFLIVYDVTARDSFDSARRWLDEIEEKGDPDSIVFLVANKIDQTRVVSRADGESFAVQHKIHGFYEVSAKTGEGVAAMVDALLRLALAPAAASASPPRPQDDPQTVRLEPTLPAVIAQLSC